jgi:hypothetical protein
VQYLMSEGFLRCLAPRPRILVCAPSNAATDELLQRILSGCFRDVTGSQYYPKVTRVGSEEALGEEVKQVRGGQLGHMVRECSCMQLGPHLLLSGGFGYGGHVAYSSGTDAPASQCRGRVIL